MKKLLLSCFVVAMIITVAHCHRESPLSSTGDPIYGCAICPPPRGGKHEGIILLLTKKVSEDMANRFWLFSSEPLRGVQIQLPERDKKTSTLWTAIVIGYLDLLPEYFVPPLIDKYHVKYVTVKLSE